MCKWIPLTSCVARTTWKSTYRYTAWRENEGIPFCDDFTVSFATWIVYFILWSKWEPSLVLYCKREWDNPVSGYPCYSFLVAWPTDGLFQKRAERDYNIIEKASIAHFANVLISQHENQMKPPDRLLLALAVAQEIDIHQQTTYTGKKVRGCFVYI